MPKTRQSGRRKMSRVRGESVKPARRRLIAAPASPIDRAMTHPTPVLVFDLDGTLAETAGDLMGTLNVILAREGLAPLPLASARYLLGAGARALIARGFAAGRPGADARKAASACSATFSPITTPISPTTAGFFPASRRRSIAQRRRAARSPSAPTSWSIRRIFCCARWASPIVSSSSAARTRSASPSPIRSR